VNHSVIEYDLKMLGLRPQNRLLWIAPVITRSRPAVGALESFAYHGWKTSFDGEDRVVASTRSAGLIFPQMRPHVIFDATAERHSKPFPIDIFPRRREVGLIVYDHDELMRVFHADSSAILSGREHPDLAADRLIRDAGLRPRRRETCVLIELQNLTGKVGVEFRKVGYGDGGGVRKVVLDADHISAQSAYYCFGLCVPSRTEQARLIAALRPNRAMYYTEAIPYPRA
jgi:hypothetical protein